MTAHTSVLPWLVKAAVAPTAVSSPVPHRSMVLSDHGEDYRPLAGAGAGPGSGGEVLLQVVGDLLSGRGQQCPAEGHLHTWE